MTFLKGGAETYKGHELLVHEAQDMGAERVAIASIIPGLTRPPLPDAVLGRGRTDEEAFQDALSKARHYIDTKRP